LPRARSWEPPAEPMPRPSRSATSLSSARRGLV
jgi:hypothetical protein